jgi:putative methyltransferase (TIGR04325 family)
MLKVKNGEAAFERDSVVFAFIEHQFPLLAGLMRAGTADGGRLSVLDYGGSLGSTYFQCRDFLSTVKELRWSIVEQPGHVACGRDDFANKQLYFYETIAECLQAERPNVLLLSGVVQCLPKPYDFLNDILQYEFAHIIVDRTAFASNGRDRLTVEHVPAWIYPASYPSWFLSEKRFLAHFEPRYKLVASFPALDAIDPEGGKAKYKGFIFELKGLA